MLFADFALVVTLDEGLVAAVLLSIVWVIKFALRIGCVGLCPRGVYQC